MPEEQRGPQNLNLKGSPWHLCNQGKAVKRQGWIPDLRWNVRISLRTRADKSAVFSNLMKHINTETLKEAFDALDGKKALGVDRVSKEAYSKRLEANLLSLYKRLQEGSYKPQPKREVLIPKADGKTRPLAIACFEDKIVDCVVSKILTSVYDPLFIRNSFGYRPSKSADGAVKACYNSLKKGRRTFVVEMDFKSFFNTIPHQKLMKVISRKVHDHRFKRLIVCFLKSEVLREGVPTQTSVGTPQGGLMSPVLANIYLNEVLDQWFLGNWANHSRTIVRYADDAVFFFTKEDDADRFMVQLKERTEGYGLILHPEKTKKLRMNKVSKESFDFLGFTFYWGKQGARCELKVKTKKKALINAIREFYDWAKTIRNKYKLSEIWNMAKARIEGHLNYFGYAINNLKCNHFCHEAVKSLYKWLNRRSQKRSYNWEGFKERIRNTPLYTDFEVRKWKQLGASFGRI
jgi:RNA-directed DNA polymerase